MYHWCIFGATFLALKKEKPSLNIVRKGFLLLSGLWQISRPLRDFVANAQLRFHHYGAVAPWAPRLIIVLSVSFIPIVSAKTVVVAIFVTGILKRVT